MRSLLSACAKEEFYCHKRSESHSTVRRGAKSQLGREGAVLAVNECAVIGVKKEEVLAKPEVPLPALSSVPIEDILL